MLDLQQLPPDILDLVFKKLNKRDILNILIFDDKKIIKFIYDNVIYDNESTLILKRFEKKKDYKYHYKKKMSHGFYLLKKVVKKYDTETQKTIITNIYGITSTKKTISEYELWELEYEKIRYCNICCKKKCLACQEFNYCLTCCKKMFSM